MATYSLLSWIAMRVSHMLVASEYELSDVRACERLCWPCRCVVDGGEEERFVTSKQKQVYLRGNFALLE